MELQHAGRFQRRRHQASSEALNYLVDHGSIRPVYGQYVWTSDVKRKKSYFSVYRDKVLADISSIPGVSNTARLYTGPLYDDTGFAAYPVFVIPGVGRKFYD